MADKGLRAVLANAFELDGIFSHVSLTCPDCAEQAAELAIKAMERAGYTIIPPTSGTVYSCGHQHKSRAEAAACPEQMIATARPLDVD